MNGLFTHHTNQLNLNRFVTSSDWNMEEMNRVKIKVINEVEGDGVVVLDDYISVNMEEDLWNRMGIMIIVKVEWFSVGR